jgi:hypothetical protein
MRLYGQEPSQEPLGAATTEDPLALRAPPLAEKSDEIRHFRWSVSRRARSKEGKHDHPAEEGEHEPPPPPAEETPESIDDMESLDDSDDEDDQVYADARKMWKIFRTCFQGI